VKLALLLGGGLVALVVGCQNDEIRRYQVPRIEDQPPAASGVKVLQRLLVAIVPHGDSTWFFKLMGPDQEVEEQRNAFDRFVQSLHFTGQANQPVTWTVPEGWHQEPAKELRHATFRAGPKETASELTVIRLEGKAGSMLANVNRWRGQIGLPPITEAELGKVSKELKVDGLAATLVEMTGQGSGAAGKMPPFAAGRPAPPSSGPGAARASGLKYTAPAGWEELPSTGGMRVAAFRVAEGGQVAEVTVIPLAGTVGGLLDNVNRWRDQIKLPPTTEEQLRQETRQLQVGGVASSYVDLAGPEAAGARRERILGVVVPRGGQTWFFKMKGSADFVARQKPAFETFLGSVRWAADTGDNHG